jgi:hypothetical protein
MQMVVICSGGVVDGRRISQGHVCAGEHTESCGAFDGHWTVIDTVLQFV